MRFAFLHGGPGFNSVAEEAILGPLFVCGGHEITFWNEPSRLRPDGDPFDATGAFERWLTSAERLVLRSAASMPVHLIAHSFTVRAAMEIARRHPSRLSSLVFVAPNVDTFEGYRNVLRLAHEDLIETNPEAASAIARSLADTRAVLDAAMRDGILNALYDDRIFTHYFADADQMRRTMAAWSSAEGQFDVDSLFAVLADFGQRGHSLLSTAPVTVPTLALFGAHDRVTSAEEQSPALRAAVPGARIEVLDGCSHFVHLDRPQYFVDIVVAWASEP
jgi:pimeloyl-ACP methyl ester carboxylesterase